MAMRADEGTVDIETGSHAETRRCAGMLQRAVDQRRSIETEGEQV